MKTLVTLPHYNPCSSVSSRSRDEAQLKVHLAWLHLEAQEKAQDRQAQLEFRLQVKRLEIEAHKAVRLCQLELESQKGTPRAEVAMSDPLSNPASAPQDSFNISKHRLGASFPRD